MSKNNSKTLFSNFESQIKELESLVNKMSQDELPLNEAIECFEKGMKLSQTCEETLQKAKQKIDTIDQKNK